MSRKSRLGLISSLLCLALLGIAQWFFGNLYEAVVTAPNWRVGFEYEAVTRRPQHADRPMRYYVPSTWLAAVLLWVATGVAWRPLPRTRGWLFAASGSALAAVVLTAYIVTQLNLRLFFAVPSKNVEWAAPLMEQWQVLNAVRVAILGFSLVATAGSLRLVHRATVLESLGAPSPDAGPA